MELAYLTPCTCTVWDFWGPQVVANEPTNHAPGWLHFYPSLHVLLALFLILFLFLPSSTSLPLLFLSVFSLSSSSFLFMVYEALSTEVCLA